ncbi:hypothetical protein SAMN05421788_112129 [Filimonas lacunae]|uniref:Tetratricopeptide repeat protein n=1 Tax=Filimonas lacunae TaxID=477680 RepID=A0A173MLG5_9BACT|nr:hypothetical protein [Filimonas lacunae]BAV08320.1 hypothetical protein FLA_4356 [Filimonas lacunae]SIT33354.1 hypothetical protein SAMN05421788_112129 [Filimonas lacunae]
MTQRFIVAVLLAFSGIFQSSAQTGNTSDDYYTLVSDMMVSYGNQQYDNALNTFKKVLVFKEQCNATDYYYGAACAAITHKQALAFTYLRESVKKGWLDTLRIQENSEFDTVRMAKEWKPLIQDIRARYQKLLEVFKGVKGKKTDDLVPYTNNGNWGWMDKNTGRAVSPAFFDETGFAEQGALVFKYKDMDYHYLNNRITVLNLEAGMELKDMERLEDAVPATDGGEQTVEISHPGNVPAELVKRYVAVKTAKGWNVLDKSSQKVIGKHDYQSIKRIAGNVYFLVTTASREFYMDANGKEYIVAAP